MTPEYTDLGWKWAAGSTVSALMMGAAVFLGVRLADPLSSSLQHQLNDQIRANTEMHTRSRIDRDHLHATEARIANIQAEVLGRLGAMESEHAELKAPKGDDR